MDYNYLNLPANENIFRTLIEESPSPVGLYVGPELVIQLVNKSILKVWGKDESVLGKTFLQALPEMENQPFVGILKNVFATGIPYEANAEKVFLFIDGELKTFYFNFNYQPLKDEQGKVWGILNTASDVTELVLTRQKLADTEERIQFALDSAGFGTWDFDPQNNTVKWDDRCKQLFGFSKNDEINYNDLLKHIHPDDQALVDEAVQQALKPDGEGRYDIEFRTIGAEDKITRWLRCKGKAYFNENGNCIRFAGTALDIGSEINERDEQRRLITLIDNTSDFISLSEPSGNVTYVNASGKAMLGLGKGNKVAHNSQFLMPDDARRLNEEINPTLLEGGKWSGRVTFRHFVTGEAIPVQVTSIMIFDTYGAPRGRATIARDLRRELADKVALIQSEQLLQKLTSASPTALWIADAEGLITYVNKTWADWTGQSIEETLGTGWLNAIVEEDRGRAARKFIHDLNKQRVYDIDFRMQRNDGEIRWFIAIGNPQYDAGGKFTGYVGSCTDVTEKTKIDIALQEKNNELNDQISQFAFVTDFMPAQLWTFDTGGMLDYVNRQTKHYFGLPVEEIFGNKWLQLVHPEDRERCSTQWLQALATNELFECEFRLLNSAGEYRWHLSRALPFTDDGAIVKWFGTNTDIDEQKQLARQKDDFLGIASHELKTPVTSVKAYAQVLGAMLTQEGEDKKAGMVMKMDAQLNRLTNLIGDLLDVTKINSGKILFNKTWFDVNAVVQDTVQDIQHTTNRHILVMDFEEAGQVYSDKERIGQVLTNLITNAIKYSPHANRVVIGTRREEDSVIVTVQDFGIGIPKEKLEKVFEQFYRVGGSNQHTFPGLGLGLYISNEIIRREGGKMWVESEEEKGSVFCFSLPVIKDVVTEN
ncbi:PAS domain-containing protein [Mucilaginibacter sp. 21P]|uniref:PAS domain S-box protein n=1 Tax=Mucilaginibacter sp. 21P TaxID=2778902 RepID=UPI001C55F10F|nr:PAS domain S-box protein [Mucilaginibacter sp. 21P]QXV65166.1 PAS domain-containing protein [Mucilaginibacter sp. 21P]